MGLRSVLVEKSKKIQLAQEEIYILEVDAEKDIVEQGLGSLREIQIAALENEIIPARYLRNYGTIGKDGQLKLLKAKVVVAGAGGLGGWIIETLARIGVGELTVIDGDVFEDNNLNRQLFCTEYNLGEGKAEAAKRRVANINGAVEVEAQAIWLREENVRGVLADARVVVDALDNLPTRFLLQDEAGKMQIPFVHGAIGGYQGQVMTVMPEDKGLDLIYPGGRQGREKGVETLLGNPATTPIITASWQAQEVVKIILGQGELIRNKLLYLDALNGVAEVLTLI